MVDKEKEVIQWDNWLLEAVRKIRTQKQRPGLDRIYNAVRLLAEKHELAEHSQKSPIAPIYHVKFNQIKIEQVQRHLDRAVKKGLLLKIYSKGQATYKAVDKSERTLNLAKEQVGGDNGNGELSKCILKVIRELSECDAPVPTSSSVTVSSLNKPPKLGYTFDTIEEYIRHSHVIIYPDDSPPDFLPNLVKQALAKECTRGKLEQVSGEYYRLPPEKQGTSSSTSSQGTPSSGGSKGKTSTANPTASSSISSSSNSNSSWSSTTSSNTAAPTTFSEAASSTSKVKSATASSSSSSSGASLGTSLIKKDSGISGKMKGTPKEGSPSAGTSSSPPRGNLTGDLLTEAEEIALVTEQTARAVKLVLKDRRPGEKPAQKKSSPPPEVFAVKTPAPPLPPPEIPTLPSSQLPTDQTEPEKKQLTGSASISSVGNIDEDSSVAANVASRRASVNSAGESSGNNGNGNGGTAPGGNGQNSKNGNKGSAVIKLMVPAFPGRNGNGNGNGAAKNGNGNGGNGGTANPAGTSSGNGGNKSPPLGKGLTTATPAASQSQSDKNSKTVSTTPALVLVGQSNNNNSPVVASATVAASATSTPVAIATTSTSAKAGTSSTGSAGVMSMTNIASVVMSKVSLERKLKFDLIIFMQTCILGHLMIAYEHIYIHHILTFAYISRSCSSYFCECLFCEVHTSTLL